MKTISKTVKHTPTPWSISSVPGDNYVMARVGHEKVNVAQVIGHSRVNPEEFDANKEFIVRACNAHEELVGAVTLALDYLAPDHNNGHTRAWTEGMIESLRRALAKAEGQP